MDATAWDERYAASELVWSLGPNAFVEQQVADLPPGRALDLAAGEGRNALWLAGRGWDVTALDFSLVGVDTGRQLAADRGVDVTWVVADATTWRDEGAFDLVVVCYLQLVEEQFAAALDNAAASLAPGGTLLVLAHDADNLERGHGGPPDPAVLPDVAQVLRALEPHGLAVPSAGQVERHVETDDGPRTAIDLLVRAVRPG